MNIRNFALYMLVSFFALEAVECMGGTPRLYPSTLSMSAGERAYLRGADLIPGETISIIVNKTTKVYYVDFSGNLNQDITAYPGPTTSANFVLTYSASTWQSGITTNFSIEYAPEHIDPPHSKIINWFFYSGGTSVYLWTELGIGRAYEAQWSSRVDGPWVSVGDLKKFWMDDEGTNVFFNFIIPPSTNAFFRITSVP